MVGYLAKSIVCLAIILLVYLLALEREKMHKFNRVYLMLGLLLALIIPFLPSGEVIYETYSNSPILFNDGSAIVVHDSIEPVTSSSWFSWERILIGIYSIVMIVMLIRFLKNVVELINKSHSNESVIYDDVRLILLDEEVLPHTFLGNIYVSKSQYQSGAIDEKLLAHEYAHASQRHSWDVLLIELVKAIFWFNPILILYKRVIQLNHEFLADEEVLQQYNDVSNYQHLLVDTCQNNNQIYLASNINFLLTKKRLKMMTKKSSRKKIYMLMAGIVPVAIGLVMLLGQPVIAQTEPEVNISTNDKPSDKQELRQWLFMRGIGLHVPTSFSPNGDSKNERLIVQKRGIKSVSSYRLTIFNKFGEMMFESTDWNEGWNGKVNNVKGKPQGGVYVYSLWYEDSDGLEHKKNGEIKLVMDPNQMIPVVDKGKVKKVKITDIDTIPIPPPPPKVNKNVPPPPPPPPPKAPNMKKGGIVPPPPPPPAVRSVKEVADEIKSKKMTYYIDGKKSTSEEVEKLDPNAVERVDVIKQNGGKVLRVITKSQNGNGVSFLKDGSPMYKGKTIRELAKAGAKVYINGDLMYNEVAKTLCDENRYSSILVTECGDGTLKVELESNDDDGSNKEQPRFKGKSFNELVSNGAEVYLDDKLIPDATSILGKGNVYDIVYTAENEDGKMVIKLESNN